MVGGSGDIQLHVVVAVVVPVDADETDTSVHCRQVGYRVQRSTGRA